MDYNPRALHRGSLATELMIPRLRNGFNVLARRGSLRNFSTAAPSGGDERYWALGAAAVGLPTFYFVYRQNQKKKEAAHKDIPSANDTVVLKSLQSEHIREDDGAQATKNAMPASKTIRAKYVLVGGGLASFAAMEAILAKDSAADILIITDESYPPYMRPPLSKELWYNVEGNPESELEFADWHGERKPIFFQDVSFYETKNIAEPVAGRVRLMLGKRAMGIDKDRKSIALNDGTTIGYEKVLIATGSSPKQLDVVDPNVTKISTLRSIDDFKKLKEIARTAQKIAIVGGGFIGSELAAALNSFSVLERSRPLEIVQIFPESGNMALVLPRYLSAWTMKQLANLGIDIRPNSNIASISKTADDRVEIKLGGRTETDEITAAQEESSVVVDHVLVAIGAAPNAGLVSAEDLDRTSDFGAGGVKVDEHLHAGKSIFGAGDVISFPDSALNLQRRVEHYDHALASGKLAGLNMAEEDSKLQPYDSLSMFWSDLGPKIGYEAVGLVDSSLTTVGIWAKGEAESTPEKASLDPTDVRTESIGQTSSRSEEASQSSLAKPGNGTASPPPEYRKGLVLYVRDRKIVGILMFNLFNRISLARSVIKQGMTTEHLQDIVDIFNINEL